MGIRNAVVEKQNATRAAGLVDALLNADIAQVPPTSSKQHRLRIAAGPIRCCTKSTTRRQTGSPQKLHASLALLPVDASKVDYLHDRLLDRSTAGSSGDP